MLDRHVEQVRLLLSTLPEIARETVFALKGGTAINLFYRDMPRLSVDIDLTYLPVGDRGSSLRDIDEAFDRIAMAIAARSPRIEARRIAGGGQSETRIMVSDGRSRVKIETSPVTRGAVHPARPMAATTGASALARTTPWDCSAARSWPTSTWRLRFPRVEHGSGPRSVPASR